MQSNEHYKLVQLASGVYSVHSLSHRETFHPVVGPVAEAEALYVHQLRLAERLEAHSGEFVIWDVGLGAAANVITVLRGIRDIPRNVKIVSFDHTMEPLQFALRHVKELEYLSGFEAELEELISEGSSNFATGQLQVQWTLQLADFPLLVSQSAAENLPKPHAILFDAFSPAKNPAMWTLPLFSDLFQLLDRNRPCALPTYSRSTMLRVSLLLAGFYVGAGHATGEKEETTIAANTLELISEPLDCEWLRRAHKSTSAEPMREPVYRQMPLLPETWDKLQQHPQFKAK